MKYYNKVGNYQLTYERLIESNSNSILKKIYHYYNMIVDNDIQSIMEEYNYQCDTCYDNSIVCTSCNGTGSIINYFLKVEVREFFEKVIRKYDYLTNDVNSFFRNYNNKDKILQIFDSIIDKIVLGLIK